MTDEREYLDLLRRVMTQGSPRADRTGVGTRALFGQTLRFDLSDGRVPILTTKRVYWKTAIKELLWFLTGGTNIADLLRENVRIWTDWPLDRYRRATGEAITQDAFEARILADRDFAEQWGDLGPVYGKQWRDWVDPDGRHHDQVATLIDTIKADPTSRRLLFHAWNVGELDRMALPPCHMVYEYFVADGRLSGLLLQRSCDLFLGAGFNLISAAALLRMIAQQTGLEPGEFVWVGGDTHIYANHFDQVETQLAREPRAFPTLRFARTPASIDDYRIEDFVVEGYDPHPAIHGDVAV